MSIDKRTETIMDIITAIMSIITAMMQRMGVPLAHVDLRDALFQAFVQDVGPYHELPAPETMADFADSDPDATDHARALARDYPNVNAVLCARMGY